MKTENQYIQVIKVKVGVMIRITLFVANVIAIRRYNATLSFYRIIVARKQQFLYTD